jgi:hypothetical protein
MKRILGVLATAALLVPATQTQAAVQPDCKLFTALALEVGWQKRDIPRLMQICARESKGFARAWNQRDPYTGSYGLMQINGSNKGFLQDAGIVRKAMQELWSPRKNLRAALALFKRHGWAPWKGNSAPKIVVPYTR